MPTASSKQIAKAVGEGEKIDAKQAVRIACQTFTEFFPNLAKANLMLEEIEDSENGKDWLITLGYDIEPPAGFHSALFQSRNYRAYKVLRIDSVSGKVGSMKIKAHRISSHAGCFDSEVSAERHSRRYQPPGRLYHRQS